MNLTPWLTELEERIDAEEEERLRREWFDFCDGKHEGGIFRPRRVPKSPTIEFPAVNVNDALADDDLMILQQLCGVSALLERGGGTLAQVRPNFGVGTLASVFGAELYVMPREYDTLPNVRPLKGIEAIRALGEAPVPDKSGSFMESAFRVGEKLARALEPYPKLREYVRMDHPDMQGPMDTLELLRGSDIFYDFYDEPDTLKAALSVITDAYIRFMGEWFALLPPRDEYHGYFGMMHRGLVTVREDSFMNLSPELYEEFAKPCDGRIFARFGGALHFCGRGDHFIGRAAALEGVYAVNMSQPHLNDMDKIFAGTVDVGVNLIGLADKAANLRPACSRIHAE